MDAAHGGRAFEVGDGAGQPQCAGPAAGGQVSGTISGPPCTGQYLFQFNAAYMNAQGLNAGQDVYAQYWSRDQGFAPPNNVGLTPGLHFQIAP